MAQKQENPFLSLVLNIIIPSYLMTKIKVAGAFVQSNTPANILAQFNDPEAFGRVTVLIIALAFPFCYGIKDFRDRHQVNFISILGVVSVLLTGIFALTELSSQWFAVKEASVPALIGTAILISMRTQFPLVKKLLVNDSLLNLDLIYQRLKLKGKEEAFEKLLVQSSYLLATSFFLSAVLNYALAKYLLVAEPGSDEFIEQLGKMTAWSWPVIVVPSMVIMIFALWQLIRGVKKLTDLELEQIMRTQAPSKD